MRSNFNNLSLHFDVGKTTAVRTTCYFKATRSAFVMVITCGDFHGRRRALLLLSLGRLRRRCGILLFLLLFIAHSDSDSQYKPHNQKVHQYNRALLFRCWDCNSATLLSKSQLDGPKTPAFITIQKHGYFGKLMTFALQNRFEIITMRAAQITTIKSTTLSLHYPPFTHSPVIVFHSKR